MSKDGTFLAVFPRGKELQNGSYRTPDTVKKISRYAFSFRIGAANIIMGLNVSEIYDYSFYSLSTSADQAVTITFEDTETIWQASSSGTIYNINGYFEEESPFTLYNDLTKDSYGKTHGSLFQQ